MTPYTVKVPLNYDEPEGPHIEIFFRVVNDIQRAGSEKQPWLLYLQGEPFASPATPDCS